MNEVLEKHPGATGALETKIHSTHEGMRVEVGTPFLETRARLHPRAARAIIERRPDLEHLFDDLKAGLPH